MTRDDLHTATPDAAAAVEAAHALPDEPAVTWDDIPEHERPTTWQPNWTGFYGTSS